ncbi:MAG: DUF4129 domain-containing protein [Anaerolineae bacterium]|nr:DUF4129 domain-containing protein [Anaerolineae bacterium]
MDSRARRQLRILILLGFAVAAVLVLATSLAQVEFPPGESFAFALERAPRPPTGMGVTTSPTLLLILRVVFLLTLALLPFSIFYLLISAEARKRVLQNLIIYGTFILLIYLLRRQLQAGAESDFLSGLNLMPAGSPAATRPPVEFNASAPSWLVLLVSFVMAGFIVALFIAVVWSVARRRSPAGRAVSLEALAETAEEARSAIEAGGDLRNTIIRCYVEMNRVVRETRGIQRDRAMTPREFEERLEHAGLPAAQVRDLTLLFEDVRYGAKELGPWEGRRAMACLAAIAESCRALTIE